MTPSQRCQIWYGTGERKAVLFRGGKLRSKSLVRCGCGLQFQRCEGLRPQQTGDRFKHLRTYLKIDLRPLLPQLESPKRFRFTRYEWVTQLDNYNCGIFILMFFELYILGYDNAPSDLEGKLVLQCTSIATETLAKY
ncbi:hypothetical protein GQ600_7510 [Phytophthora cactorum]|nr:hypothetical protein GQ600_7510 [Phytophthora cactorum]